MCPTLQNYNNIDKLTYKRYMKSDFTDLLFEFAFSQFEKNFDMYVYFVYFTKNNKINKKKRLQNKEGQWAGTENNAI